MVKVKEPTENFCEKFKHRVNSKLEAEPEWKNLIHNVGVQVWRVKEFKLERVPEDQIGTFYDGDSYVILSIYEKSPNRYGYDVYIWIGKHSTSDEYGTAAYKMAELDLDILKDMAVQHREVQGCESKNFLCLFPKLCVLKGGYETGYHKIEETAKVEKLYHISGVKNNISVREISYRRENITNDDVFIIDLGTELYQINGKTCSKEEKFKGATVFKELHEKRGNCKIEIFDNFDIETSNGIVDKMPAKNKPTLVKPVKKEIECSLWKVSDESGKLEITIIKNGAASKGDFNSNDVFIFESNDLIYVWIGKSTSKNEKMYGVLYAQKHAFQKGRENDPIEKIIEGNESKEFLSRLA